jgi:ATP-binding cassette subfamily B (MDR/TAP) protein 1
MESGHGAVPEDPEDDIRAKLNRSQSRQSASSVALAGRTTEPQRKYSLWKLMKVIASFNKQEWKLMLIGLFWSAICGCGNPTQALFFAKLISVL